MTKTKKSTRLQAKKSNKISVGMLLLIFIATATVVLAGLYIFAPRKTQNEEQPEAVTTTTPLPQRNEEAGEKAPLQNEGEDPNTVEDITGIVTSSNIIGYTLRIRTNIDQYISGTCTLKMTYTGEEEPTLKTDYSETVDIVDSASTSTCEGFDVNIAPLQSGSYTFEISIASSDNRKGTITGEVELP